MKKQKKYHRNDEGFVMVAALLVLLVLTVMGIAVNRNTMTEWRIAMNDRYHKNAFYAADAATELGAEILEQSIACLGFDDNGVVLYGKEGSGLNVYIKPESGGFWREYSTTALTPPADDADADLVFPAVIDEDGTFNEAKTKEQPYANITMRGNTQLTPGSAIQMAAGYEGTAKGLGGNGASLVYDIMVYQKGENNAASAICTQYRHNLGSEGECHY